MDRNLFGVKNNEKIIQNRYVFFHIKSTFWKQSNKRNRKYTNSCIEKSGKNNPTQIENFKKAIDYGKLNNVEVKITINGGK